MVWKICLPRDQLRDRLQDNLLRRDHISEKRREVFQDLLQNHLVQVWRDRKELRVNLQDHINQGSHKLEESFLDQPWGNHHDQLLERDHINLQGRLLVNPDHINLDHNKRLVTELSNLQRKLQLRDNDQNHNMAWGK